MKNIKPYEKANEIWNTFLDLELEYFTGSSVYEHARESSIICVNLLISNPCNTSSQIEFYEQVKLILEKNQHEIIK